MNRQSIKQLLELYPGAQLVTDVELAPDLAAMRGIVGQAVTDPAGNPVQVKLRYTQESAAVSTFRYVTGGRSIRGTSGLALEVACSDTSWLLYSDSKSNRRGHLAAVWRPAAKPPVVETHPIGALVVRPHDIWFGNGGFGPQVRIARYDSKEQRVYYVYTETGNTGSIELDMFLRNYDLQHTAEEYRQVLAERAARRQKSSW